jgi:hypothetical protein
MPEQCDPRSALETHRLNLEPEFDGLFGPPLLFPIARVSESQWSIELMSRSNAGGVVFSNEFDHVFIEYPSFTDLVEVYAELIEEGRFTQWDNGRGSLSLEDERERQDARIQAAGLEGLYGDRREIDLDQSAWPAHWLESAEIEPEDREPLGASHTIAELVQASASGPLSARIAGEVVRIVGVGGGNLPVVDDGTGTLDVWCPAGTSPWWAGSSGTRFELAVTVDKPVPPPIDLDAWHREVQAHGLAGRLHEAGASIAAMTADLEQHPPAVVATDIRPLD